MIKTIFHVVKLKRMKVKLKERCVYHRSIVKMKKDPCYILI
jgi:hypothetical protein